MGLTNYNEYSSGGSEQYTPWGSYFKPSPARSSSFIEGATKGVDAVMEEFRKNGSDSPYDPDEDKNYYPKALSGMGPSSMYLRQKSWPAPDSTPAVRLPRPSDWTSALSADLLNRPAEVAVPNLLVAEEASEQRGITEQQMRVLRSIPNAVLYPLLRELEQSRQRANGRKQEEQECRFCKNNGERASYYRSHPLRAGGRVACPVLRAFVCRRCGARGDSAHTLKYCPLTSAEERSKSAAMMRSLRSGSVRRSQASSNDMDDFLMFGETTPSVIADENVYNNRESYPLDPVWAALEQKLML